MLGRSVFFNGEFEFSEERDDAVFVEEQAIGYRQQVSMVFVVGEAVDTVSTGLRGEEIIEAVEESAVDEGRLLEEGLQ